jgi:hypothetical protein
MPAPPSRRAPATRSSARTLVGSAESRATASRSSGRLGAITRVSMTRSGEWARTAGGIRLSVRLIRLMRSRSLARASKKMLASMCEPTSASDGYSLAGIDG